MLLFLKRLGLPVQFSHIGTLSLAARTRAAGCTCSTFDEAKARAKGAQESLDAYFWPPLRDWHSKTILSQMDAGYAEFCSRCAAHFARAVSSQRKKPKGYQATCVEILHAEQADHDPLPALLKRLRRFSDADAAFLHNRVSNVIQALRRSAPCSSIAVVLRTWLNGWTTSRRFSQTVLECRFCGSGEDSLEHYLRRDIVVGAWLSRYGNASRDTRPEAFLMLTDASCGHRNSHIPARAVFLDCMHSAYQELKHANTFGIEPQELQRTCTTRGQTPSR